MVVASAVVAVVEASDAVVVANDDVVAAEAVAGEVGSVFGIAATRNVTKE